MTYYSNTMTWPARVLNDGSGWSGRRRFALEDFIVSESVRFKLEERIEIEEIQRRNAKLNDLLAENPTSWSSLLWTNGGVARHLLDKINALCERWNDEDEKRGLTWTAFSVGLEQYSNICAGFFHGEQPQFWIRCDYLPHRQWQENLKHDHEINLSQLGLPEKSPIEKVEDSSLE